MFQAFFIRKCGMSINLLNKGFYFIGYVIKPGRINLRKAVINKSFYKVNKWNCLPDKFTEPKLLQIRDLMNGFLGLAVKVDSYKYRKKIRF